VCIFAKICYFAQKWLIMQNERLKCNVKDEGHLKVSSLAVPACSGLCK
jgi:hypothetical protein